MQPNVTDIVSLHEVNANLQSSCVPVLLNHNQLYFSTIVAFNNALNPRQISAFSDGGA